MSEVLLKSVPGWLVEGLITNSLNINVLAKDVDQVLVYEFWVIR